MNSINVVGRLGRDAEQRYTSGGTAVCNFSIAVDRRGKDNEGEKKPPLWLKVVLWGKLGETIGKYLKKGKQVAIQGELDIREFDRKEGGKGTSVEINARQVTLLGGGQDAEKPAEPESAPEISDDDIPF